MSQIIELYGRLSFPALFNKKAGQNGGPERFSASLLMPKGSDAARKLEDAIRKTAEDKWNGRAAQILAGLKAQDRICMHDGNLKAYDGYQGMDYISASNAGRPVVVNRRGQPVAEGDEQAPYAGCYVNMNLELWAQDNQYGKRINATLRGVQFVKNGDAFSGGPAPMQTSDFTDLGDEDDDLM